MSSARVSVVCISNIIRRIIVVIVLWFFKPWAHPWILIHKILIDLNAI